ncbi:MAG: NAD-dependent epimerase/dehydratase family protein, partial [Pirellulaceae bacterium]|nr:NAD-dependent epimerase/dehydratase family protein [Pirellulaceae bacterium]
MTSSADPIFVTGATGFIGTRLVQALVQHGQPVRALVRRDRLEPPPGTNGPSPLEHELVELVRGDITDRDSLVCGMAGCRRVFHLAAYAKVWARDPKTYVAINVEGMRNVFAAAEQHNVERVVFTSTVRT